jgi:hypothetical protein
MLHPLKKRPSVLFNDILIYKKKKTILSKKTSSCPAIFSAPALNTPNTLSTSTFSPLSQHLFATPLLPATFPLQFLSIATFDLRNKMSFTMKSLDYFPRASRIYYVLHRLVTWSRCTHIPLVHS